ncbi:hypothetical protein KVT40_007057 [Elsinoe batatas]|uniref:NAD(P)-binding protein n=1 Tax=Elsinoe batatas TaxID=2601811 RepID=A0A8K0PD54_9PEZI|nr:hypothetical protein KVT40_007057 [Elsinoe batatas]
MSDSTKYTSKLQNKRILIIGASLEHGAHVTISSSQPSRIDRAITSLLTSYPSAKPRLQGHPADMATSSTLESNIVSLLDFATEKQSKKLDHIVWTAGDALAVMPLSDLTVEKSHPSRHGALLRPPGMSEEERQRRFKYFGEKSTTGRVGRVEDVAEAYLFLMRDQNVTGSLIWTNAGALLV